MNATSWFSMLGILLLVSRSPAQEDSNTRVNRLSNLPTSAQSLPILMAALEDVDQYVRDTALVVLRRFGPQGQPAVPAVIRLAIQDRRLRLTALETLLVLEAPESGVVPAFELALQDEDESVRAYAAELRKRLPDVKRFRENRERARERASRFGALTSLPVSEKSLPALLAALVDADQDMRRTALVTLSRFGAQGRPSVPAITRLAIRDRSLRLTALSTLQQLDAPESEILAVLKLALQDPDAGMRFAAAELDRTRRDKLPLMERLRDEEPRRRARAAQELESQVSAGGADPAEAVQALAQALKDTDASVRRQAAESLGRLGRPAHAAVPALAKALRDSDFYARFAVARTLAAVASFDELPMAALIEAMADFHSSFVAEITRPLTESGAVLATLSRGGRLGACPVYALIVFRDGSVLYQGSDHVKVSGARYKKVPPEQLTELSRSFQQADFFSLKDKYWSGATDLPSVALSYRDQRREKSVSYDAAASGVAGSFSFGAGDPAPARLFRLEKRFEEIVGSLEWVGTEAERAAIEHAKWQAIWAAQRARLPELEKAIGDARQSVRWYAAEELLQIAHVPGIDRLRSVALQKKATRVIAEKLGSPDETVRYSAVDALRKTHILDEEAVRALARALNDPSARVRSLAVAALANPNARTAVPVLLGRLGNPVPDERRGAAHALGRIGDAAAVPALVQALRDPQAEVRESAAGALAAIGPGAQSGLALLTEVLKRDPAPRVRSTAAWALDRIASGTPAVITALRAALNDPAAEVREQAERLLGIIPPWVESLFQEPK